MEIKDLKEQIIYLTRKGLTLREISKELKIATSTISAIRIQNYMPNYKVIDKLLKFPEFKEEFITMFNSNTNAECLNLLKNHKLFNKFKLSKHIITQLRYFYNLEPKMYENNYISETDRIKGYIIRNSKYTFKKRNIFFNLNYNDFELPTHCPLLGIKLTFGSQSNGNHFSHASLDRLDNNKGYIKGNVLVMSRLANAMKNQANFEQLELFSINILKLLSCLKNQGALGSITDVFPNIKLHKEI